MADDELTFNNVTDQFNNQNNFKTEKDVCDYIEDNIKLFINNNLGLNYLEHERESYIIPRGFGKNTSRIDFVVTTTNKEKVLIEVKNPKNIQRELNRSVAQVLDYYLLAERRGFKVNSAWLVITKINQSMIDIIVRFKLPINICVFSKGQTAIWRYDKEGVING